MKSILQMLLCRWRPVIAYAGKSGKAVCYHVTLPPSATEEDVYAAKEAAHGAGYTAICYHTRHDGTPQLGVFSEC